MQRSKGIHADITRGAYELFEKRGRAHGHDSDDWLEAEKMVMKNRDRHASEIKHEVDIAKKPRVAFRQTVKKEGFYKKG